MWVKQGNIWPIRQIMAMCLLILLIYTEMEQPKDFIFVVNILKLEITVWYSRELYILNRGTSKNMFHSLLVDSFFHLPLDTSSS